MKNKIIKKTVIFTDYNCNNNCIFCIDAEKRQLRPKSTEEIKAEIVSSKNRGTTYIEFIGGEFTIRPDALGLVRFAKDMGFKTITMATNGRIFSYKNFAQSMINAGLTDIVFSIHGHNEKLHDTLTRSSGSFKQLCSGLKNLKKLGFKKIGSNTTIVKQNYKQLPEIGKFLIKHGIRNSEFIFVDPNYGAAKLNFQKLVPKISQAAPYMRKCLDLGKKFPHWHVRYVPLCYFSGYLDQVSELDEVKKFRTEHIALDFQNYSVESSRATVGRAKGKVCKNCSLNANCEGIWKEYIKRYGDKELIAIK